MLIEITYESGERTKAQTNDQNMNALLGRLNAPGIRWIDANGDKKIFLNVEKAVRIKEIPEPSPPE